MNLSFNFILEDERTYIVVLINSVLFNKPVNSGRLLFYYWEYMRYRYRK